VRFVAVDISSTRGRADVDAEDAALAGLDVDGDRRGLARHRASRNTGVPKVNDASPVPILKWHERPNYSDPEQMSDRAEDLSRFIERLTARFKETEALFASRLESPTGSSRC